MKNEKAAMGDEDRKYIEMAIDFAIDNIESGGGPFGAVIVRTGDFVAGAGNRVTALKDPTAHAEVMAIRLAAEKLGTHDLSGCTLYASCEPCPMCLGAIYWAGIGRVVYAAGRHDAARAGFSDEYIYRELALPPGHRSIDFISCSLERAGEVFDRWETYPGKIPY